jgi:hypothetical protein
MLMYHVAPLKSNDVLRTCIEQLVPSLPQFETKVVSIVRGEEFDDPGEVISLLSDRDIQYILFENDRTLGEAVTFLSMLEAIYDAYSRSEGVSATFYGHTKGVSRADNPAVHLWRDAMFQACLRDFSIVAEFLSSSSCAGAFKKRGNAFKGEGIVKNNFHYAGSFFWFRNDHLFGKPNWRNVEQNRFGVEAYLGQFFSDWEASCFWGGEPGSLYSLDWWSKNPYTKTRLTERS